MKSSTSNAYQLESMIRFLGPEEMTPMASRMLLEMAGQWRVQAFEDLIALEDELEEE